VIRAARMFAQVAFRNLRRSRRRSALTVSAVSFGLLCLIVFQALKVGLHREMVRSTTGLDAGLIQVHGAGYEVNLAQLRPLPAPERLATALATVGASAWALRVRAPSLLLAGAHSATVVLEGVEPDREPQVTFVAQRVVAGAYPKAGEGGVLLGAPLAESLGIGVGGEVALLVQAADGRSATRRFPVQGVYRTALISFDRTHVFLALGEAQDFLRFGDAVTEAVVAGAFGEERALAGALARLLPPGAYQVRTWEQAVPEVDQIIRLNDATMGVLIGIVFAIVALGIANTMVAAVYERFHELGVLMAVGTGPGGIFAMVLFESLILGLLASLAGTVAAIAACAYLARYGLDLTALTSANEHFATSHVLHAHLLFGDALRANAIALATALVAGLYPAAKAVRLQPVDAMRHL